MNRPILILAVKGKAAQVFPAFALFCKSQGNKKISEIGR